MSTFCSNPNCSTAHAELAEDQEKCPTCGSELRSNVQTLEEMEADRAALDAKIAAASKKTAASKVPIPTAPTPWRGPC